MNPSHKKINSTASSALDLSTKAKRKKALAFLVLDLKQIYEAESKYLQKIPDALQDSQRAYDAQDAIDLFEEALDLLDSVY